MGEGMINNESVPQKNIIPIVYSTSDKFAPLVSASIKSVMDHSEANNNYDIYVFHTGIKQSNIDLIINTSNVTNIKIMDINVTDYIKEYNLKSEISAITIETFYRLLIPDILSKYEKIIYLDADTIVNDDISLLYNTDVTGYMIAGVLDFGMIAKYYSEDDVKEYFNDVLGIVGDEYTQGGVLIFNISEIRTHTEPFSFISFVNNKKFRYCDQDALNILCKKHIGHLDSGWNAQYICYEDSDVMLKKRLPANLYSEYLKSIDNPRIIHYVGYKKPWDGYSESLAKYYWDTIRNTHLYDVNIIHLVEMKTEEKTNPKTLLKKFINRLFKK